VISIFFYYGYLPTVFNKQIDAEFIKGSFPLMDPVFSQHQEVVILKTHRQYLPLKERFLLWYESLNVEYFLNSSDERFWQSVQVSIDNC